MLGNRIEVIAISPANEDALKEAVEALSTRIDEAVAQAVPTNVNAGMGESVLGLELTTAPSPGDADFSVSADRKTRADRLSKTLLLFSHLDKNGVVQPPTMSNNGKLLFDIASKQESNRAYNDALLGTIKRTRRPTQTHYLGRWALFGEGGLTKYMATALNQGFFSQISPGLHSTIRERP